MRRATRSEKKERACRGVERPCRGCWVWEGAGCKGLRCRHHACRPFTFRFQIRIVLARQPDASSESSQLVSRSVISASWPRQVLSSAPVSADQICASR